MLSDKERIFGNELEGNIIRMKNNNKRLKITKDTEMDLIVKEGKLL